MSTSARTSAERSTPWIDVLHVVTLSAFAVAQPSFDLLGRSASFFAAHRSGPGDVVLLAVAAVLLVPVLYVAVRGAVDLVSRRAGRVVHRLFVGGLAALAIVPPISRGLGLSAVVFGLAVVVVGILFAFVYDRVRVVRRFVTVVSPAVVLFCVLFLFVSPVRAVVMPQGTQRTAAVTEGTRPDTPVVIVLLDELGLTNIVTPDGEINTERFPGLGRLADVSTWYREATSVGLRTDQAVPAILTGSRTARRDVPTSYAYPNNLFTLLSGTHDVRAREFVTQLCPPDLCPSSGRGTGGLRPLFTDAAIVYLHIVLPAELSDRWLPPLGDRWAGFTPDDDGDDTVNPDDTGGGDPVRSWLRSALVQRREQHEGELFDGFLDELDTRGRSRRPPLAYMHAQLPHPPWRYLPTGQTYPTHGSTPGYRNFRWGPDQYLADEVFQRSMLQTVYADRLVSKLLETLEERDIFDETMLVVVADHGATWDADGSRREIDRGRATQMVSVPLFVKYPDQREGRVDEDNAETIDVVPTIADVLDLDLPFEVDGASLLGPRRTGKQIFDGRRMRDIEVGFDDVRRRAKDVENIFGRGGSTDDLYGFKDYRAFVGRRLDTFGVEDERSPLTVDVAGGLERYRRVDVDGPELPALLRGTVTGGGAGRRYVAVLNGVVAGAGQTFREDDRPQVALMLSHARFREGNNDLELYELTGDDDLRRIEIR